MTQGTLFDDMPATPSPRLRWMDRHGISVRASIMDGRVVYIASRRVMGQQMGNRRGNTEDEALASLALHLGIAGWLEETYLRSPQAGQQEASV